MTLLLFCPEMKNLYEAIRFVLTVINIICRFKKFSYTLFNVIVSTVHSQWDYGIPK